MQGIIVQYASPFQARSGFTRYSQNESEHMECNERQANPPILESDVEIRCENQEIHRHRIRGAAIFVETCDLTEQSERRTIEQHRTLTLSSARTAASRRCGRFRRVGLAEIKVDSTI